MLSLGRVNWKKGLDRLIPAMEFVPGAHLVIAGNDEENYQPRLQELARLGGVADRVHFVGEARDISKWNLFAAADVFALPSYSENFGIAVLEAMASGVPVVVTKEVGFGLHRCCGRGWACGRWRTAGRGRGHRPVAGERRREARHGRRGPTRRGRAFFLGYHRPGYGRRYADIARGRAARA